MPMDKFCLMRFFSQSLRESVDLITVGNMNEIKQVYMTMDKRATLVDAMIPVSIQKEFNVNPLKALGAYWHPEHTVMRDLYENMKNRATEYIAYVDKSNQMENRGPFAEHEGCHNLYCIKNHKTSFVEVIQQAAMMTKLAKSWQPSVNDVHTMRNSFAKIADKKICDLVRDNRAEHEH